MAIRVHEREELKGMVMARKKIATTATSAGECQKSR
jgi:hypothetical protein